MLTDYPFTYAGNPANLKFSDATGELSEIEYIDRGVKTRLIISEFGFNENKLKILVKGTQAGLFTDGQYTYGPNDFTIDATSQESLDYFEQFTYNYPLIKRQMVNGTSIYYLNMVLFDPATGAFNPQVLPPPAPVEPI